MYLSREKRATLISTLVASTLVVVKLIIALLSGSVALLASAIDSLLDMLISLFNLFALKKSEESPSDHYQYGKGKVQAIAGVIEGTIITISGLYILYLAIIKWIEQEPTTLLLPSLFAMLFSIVVTLLLVLYLLKVAQETDNLVIKADALHYQTDLWSNIAVVVALVLVYFTGIEWFDALFGLAIGLYIIYSAYGIIVEGIEILLDRSLDDGTVAKIEEILSNHPEVTSYHWLRTRTDGSTNFVEFHMVLRPNILLLEAHRIADGIEDAMMLLDPKRGWIITPHFDPYDDEYVNDAMLTNRGKLL
jgi:ferrous-iron efflux pump FieF